MRGEFVFGHYPVAIADVDGRVAPFEIVAVDFVLMAVETNSFRANKEIAVHLTAVAVPQRQFAYALPEGVVPVNIIARFVADILVFAPGLAKEVVLDKRMRRGEAPAAQSDLDRTAVVGDRREIAEIVVVNPGALRHLARTRSLDGDHLTYRGFILESIVIYLIVIS